MHSYLQFPWPVQFAILFTIFFLRVMFLAGGGTLWIRFSQWAKSRKIVQQTLGEDIWSDVIHGIGILFLDAVVVVAAIHFGLVKAYEHSTAPQILITFSIFFVWLEIYFYYSHRLLHLPQLYWIHKHHHHSVATNPWTSLSFSLSERLVLLFGSVVIPGIVSQFIPMSLEGFSLYFLVNYILNVYGHLNVEIMPHAYVHTPVGKVLNTTTYHALHHQRYRGHFGLFTSVLDRLHGTKFKDYEAKHKAVVEAGIVHPTMGSRA